jgi:hypothetical protein
MSTIIKMKIKIAKFLDHGVVQSFMFVVTLYVLLGEDLRLSVAPVSIDDLFTVMNSISLVLFSVELVLASISNKDY